MCIDHTTYAGYQFILGPCRYQTQNFKQAGAVGRQVVRVEIIYSAFGRCDGIAYAEAEAGQSSLLWFPLRVCETEASQSSLLGLLGLPLRVREAEAGQSSLLGLPLRVCEVGSATCKPAHLNTLFQSTELQRRRDQRVENRRPTLPGPTSTHEAELLFAPASDVVTPPDSLDNCMASGAPAPLSLLYKKAEVLSLKRAGGFGIPRPTVS